MSLLCGRGLLTQEKKLSVGTEALQGATGTWSTERKPGSVGKLLNPFVKCAESISWRTFLPVQGFVAKAAKERRITVLVEKLGNALIAAKSFLCTAIKTRNVVAESVRTVCVPKTKTFNLTLDGENVYYANGVLVENCADALALTFADEMADLVPDDVESGRRQSWRRTSDMDPTTALEREDTW